MKISSTYFTREKVENARKNSIRYPWAAKKKENAKIRADIFFDVGLENLIDMVTPQSLPRSFAVNQEYGCPVCKNEVDKYGRWPYLANVVENPWKIICPHCKSVFPSNDFGAYYKGGKDKQGVFDPNLADRSLLVNTLYPERGPDWCVDDGFGWVSPDNKKYTFIAFYNHWKIWMKMIDERGNSFPGDYPLGHGGILYSSLDAFTEAYIFTGDLKYAGAGLSLLDRIADFYPHMDIGAYRWEDGFLNSHGGSGKGKIVGCIWDTDMARSFVKAYDAFFPAMGDLDMEQIQYKIENNILKEIYRSVISGKIRGNHGSHQSTLALAAAVLDDPVLTPFWLDYVLYGDGRIVPSLIDDIDRDGFGDEAAPSYNHIWISSFLEIADIIGTYGKYEGGCLYENPKFIKMLESFAHLVMMGSYTPQIGDSASCGNPGIIGTMDSAVKGYEITNNPLFLKMAHYLNDFTKGDIFSGDPERMKSLVESHRDKNLESSNLTGYGFAALRDGRGAFMRDLWVYFGRNTGHGHKDTLNLGIHAYGLDMAPDLGYPEKCDHTWQKTHHWDKNTTCHNTVMVGNRNQSPLVIGQSRHFEDYDSIKICDICAEGVYGETEIYRRIPGLINIDERDSYIVDLFRVKGGDDHIYIFHGASPEALCPDISLVKQDGGTYGGEEYEYGISPEQKDDLPLSGYMGNGFHYLKNVERAKNISGPFFVCWPIKDNWGVHKTKKDLYLKLSMFSEVSDISLADGIPSQNRPGNPKSLRYLLARRRGKDLNSLFVSVIEPHEGISKIKSLEKISMEPTDGCTFNSEDCAALKIVLKSGRTDYIMCSLDPEREYLVEESILFKGFYAMVSVEKDGKTTAFLCEGERLLLEGKPLISAVSKMEGIVLDFTRNLSLENEIIVRVKGNPDVDKFVNRHIYIKNDYGNNPVYKIIDATGLSDDTYALNIGNTTLISRLKNPRSAEEGFIFDIGKYDTFEIPMSTVTIDKG